MPKVTIAKAVNTEPFAAADVALKLGYFSQAGLDAKVVTLGGSSVANAALQSGSVQFVLASAASVLLATSRNVPLLVVGGINKGESLQLVVVNRWIKAHGMLSRCSDEYKSVRLPSPHISKLFTTAKMVE
jgi:ABC-type nitrate/sulfonate/bicarbonate transport system substrate-binding protein